MFPVLEVVFFQQKLCVHTHPSTDTPTHTNTHTEYWNRHMFCICRLYSHWCTNVWGWEGIAGYWTIFWGRVYGLGFVMSFLGRIIAFFKTISFKIILREGHVLSTPSPPLYPTLHSSCVHVWRMAVLLNFEDESQDICREIFFLRFPKNSEWEIIPCVKLINVF